MRSRLECVQTPVLDGCARRERSGRRSAARRHRGTEPPPGCKRHCPWRDAGQARSRRIRHQPRSRRSCDCARQGTGCLPPPSRRRSDRHHDPCCPGGCMTSTAVAVRKAAIRDIHAILELINIYAAQGIMLPRTEFEMSENIRDFSVAYDGDMLVGCGALHFYTPITAEVRSLAVRPQVKQHGIGRAIVEGLEAEAREND